MCPILLVTGGSRGIGAAISRLAAARGWDVAINYARDATAADAVAQDVRTLGRRAITLQADVADEAQVQSMFARLDRDFGPLAGLANNAGVVDQGARFVEMEAARLQRMFAINVFGTMHCCRQAVLRMSTRLGGAGGAIAVSYTHLPTPWLLPRYSPTTAPTKARPTLVCRLLNTQLVALGR